MHILVTLIVVLPLIAALITGLSCRTIGNKVAQHITSGAVIASALLSVFVFFKVAVFASVDPFVVELFRWMDFGTLKSAWSINIDVLTCVMLVVVTVVSSVVHVYSIGYMSHDPHIPRFMSYLSLFTFSMLMLVTSNDFVQLFFGWEGVGLCSYLLIGFWFKKPSANAAAMKAFIVNRVGDVGFSLGIFAIYLLFDSVQFPEVFAAVPNYTESYFTIFGMELHALSVICMLLFIGAMGKSAQLGLHTWLPDAMEGPTPVSALIHAATMVTAGVFLVARCSYLFEYAPDILNVVAIVGAVTCFFAATIAVTQNDIKKIIAYSTCSQLGYMFFACGVSAYSAGVFHLMTHAFFKALLFLCAGNVIHAMSGEQDIRKMGGIKDKIKVTYWLMMVGSIAIAGIPPFAGYFSKDIMLESAFGAHSSVGYFSYGLGLFVAFLTAFYSFRLVILTFYGNTRASREAYQHVHESPKSMLIPLFVLCAGAIFAGMLGGGTLLGFLHIDGLGITDPSGDFWRGAIYVAGAADPHSNPLEKAHHIVWWAKWAPLFAALSGIGLSFVLYQYNRAVVGKIVQAFKPIYTFLLNKWYFDELYDFAIVRPSKAIGMFFWKIIDTKIIDGCGPDGVSLVAKKLGGQVRAIQSGYIYHYAFAMILGMLAFVSWYLYS
jgi:NADH-quinone oxidoreductase subunit L